MVSSVMQLFSNLFLSNIEWTPKWGVITRHFGSYYELAFPNIGPVLHLLLEKAA